jgi:hypothetical protein
MCDCSTHRLFSWKPFVKRDALAKAYDLIPEDVQGDELYYRIKICNLRIEGQAIGRLLLHLQRKLDGYNFNELEPVINYYRERAKKLSSHMLEIRFRLNLSQDIV